MLQDQLNSRNSLDTRPMGSDFDQLNLSGSLLLLDSYDDGQFSGTFSTPTGLSKLLASPELFRVGPLSGSMGGEDVSRSNRLFLNGERLHCSTTGPLQVMTPSGLQNANGKSLGCLNHYVFVTIEEPQARGGTNHALLEKPILKMPTLTVLPKKKSIFPRGTATFHRNDW